MRLIPSDLPGVVILEPKLFADDRGFFFETYQKLAFQEAGIDIEFVQDNFSRSARGVLRGLHFQVERPQGKLVRVTQGEIFDVAVDLRPDSPTCGQWIGVYLSAENRRQVYVPPDYAHGFCALANNSDVAYKCTDYYAPGCERTLIWNDPRVGVRWPIDDPILSEKDRRGGRWDELFGAG